MSAVQSVATISQFSIEKLWIASNEEKLECLACLAYTSASRVASLATDLQTRSVILPFSQLFMPLSARPFIASNDAGKCDLQEMRRLHLHILQYLYTINMFTTVLGSQLCP